MMQGRRLIPLALAAMLAVSLAPVPRADAAARKPAEAPAPRRARYALHQFSGVVTALDKGSLTVEKSGRDAKTMVFTRHPDMKTAGDLGKDAHVTVYYRDEGGHPVARKVVVKSAAPVAER
jgi:hypothetical protein